MQVHELFESFGCGERAVAIPIFVYFSPERQRKLTVRKGRGKGYRSVIVIVFDDMKL